jgi:hypothetical protein
VLSLLWMGWWVRKRGGFGTKASAVLRSLYSIVLGVGGFLLSAQSKGVGLAATVAGALVGAWLGFHAMAGPMALVTAILGAVAGGNLVLILLDMLWAGSAADRVACGTAADTRSTDIKTETPTSAGMR